MGNGPFGVTAGESHVLDDRLFDARYRSQLVWMVGCEKYCLATARPCSAQPNSWRDRRSAPALEVSERRPQKANTPAASTTPVNTRTTPSNAPRSRRRRMRGLN